MLYRYRLDGLELRHAEASKFAMKEDRMLVRVALTSLPSASIWTVLVERVAMEFCDETLAVGATVG